MPALQYGLSSYERAEGDMPELPVINQYAEESPTEERGVILQSRPGLSDRSASMGAGPVAQLFKRDLVLGSTLYGVSNGGLYSGSTLIGTVDGSGFCSMAGNEIGLMTTQGASLYYYDGTTLSSVAFPDSANVAHIETGGSRFWAVRKDTGKLYWTDPLEADVGALDFLTAESLPDRLLQTLWIDGGLIAFGAESVEFFQQTGSSALPITPSTGLVFEKGLKATGCATAIGSTFAFVTDTNQVCFQRDDNVISNPGLEAKIEASAACRLFTFELGGIEFLALRIDNETHCWSLKTGMWSEFASYGQTNWIPQCYAGGVFGSSVDGKTLEWGSDYQDLGGQLERRFRGGFPIDGGGVQIGNVQLRLNVGQTPFLTGDYLNPKVGMRISRDAGQTWGSWRDISLGEQGKYRKRVQWRNCGLASRPAFLAEFRCTDPVPFRVAACLVNEQYGGR